MGLLSRRRSWTRIAPQSASTEPYENRKGSVQEAATSARRESERFVFVGKVRLCVCVLRLGKRRESWKSSRAIAGLIAELSQDKMSIIGDGGGDGGI